MICFSSPSSFLVFPVTGAIRRKDKELGQKKQKTWSWAAEEKREKTILLYSSMDPFEQNIIRLCPLKTVFFFQVAHFFCPCWLRVMKRKILPSFLFSPYRYIVPSSLLLECSLYTHIYIYIFPFLFFPIFPSDLPPPPHSPPSSYLINIEIEKARERSRR